jgi:hypothetical protein
MTETAWICLEASERALLLNAVRWLRDSGHAEASAIDELALKIAHSDAYPDITIGVYGGQVQWALGNPFPIRVCDYDGR